MRKRVLVAVLDWGLGHATRSIPIIKALVDAGAEVLLAGSGASLNLLKKEYPSYQAIELPAYKPRYPEANGSMAWQMAKQLPHFYRVVRSEHRELEKLITQHRIDAVISDNRYGCWSRKVPSVFVTHQSFVMMPKRFGWLRWVVHAITKSYLNKFTVCWIPDDPRHLLAGELNIPQSEHLPKRLSYIGWLSRFRKGDNIAPKNDIVAVLSGPEPQRTILENILLPQLKASGLNFLFVRGTPATDGQGDPHVVDMLTGNDLKEALEAAEIVVARSGYSTIMDLLALQKKAILIPTPGQPEQEFLATTLTRRGYFYAVPQYSFNLEEAVKGLRKIRGPEFQVNDNLLRTAVHSLLASLKL